jgi:tetraacyldisaccharide 4'-kinase
MRAPDFWQHDGWAAQALAPAAWLYAAVARRRARGVTPFVAQIPVICVGNLTTGGTGKTPVAIALAQHLQAQGRRVAFLTRGYGGRLAGPVRVDPELHGAAEAGDEPLLLAEVAPTFVARDRPAGARAAQESGAQVVVMDDGLQNPSIAKSLRLVVVDGATGFGNGRVLPAGPLRIPLEEGLAGADVFILMGEDRLSLAQGLARHAPVVHATLEPEPSAERLRGRRVYAFAGIGRPGKFFATLRALGADLVGTASFADHHRYRAGEFDRLVAAARAAGAELVTTAKDRVRLPPALREQVAVVRVRAVLADPAPLYARLAERVHG